MEDKFQTLDLNECFNKIDTIISKLEFIQKHMMTKDDVLLILNHIDALAEKSRFNDNKANLHRERLDQNTTTLQNHEIRITHLESLTQKQ